ncbi:MAG TPA: IS1595 family transposase [Steroidobacteraceae bacterium]|nr:IS1595 family transposase [Steroidobacteraceae bacterium]
MKKDAVINAPQFQDEDAAREYLEKVRWNGEPVCPHCGSLGDHYQLQGEAHRKGLYKCQDCREQFSVTLGTVFERSHIPLHKWLLAAYLLCSSKKGISSRQLQRTLQVTYKAAWFLSHRIRKAMKVAGAPISWAPAATSSKRMRLTSARSAARARLAAATTRT